MMPSDSMIMNGKDGQNGETSSGGAGTNKCEFCGVVKRNASDLRRHLAKHTGERPFVCLVSSM